MAGQTTRLMRALDQEITAKQWSEALAQCNQPSAKITKILVKINFRPWIPHKTEADKDAVYEKRTVTSESISFSNDPELYVRKAEESFRAYRAEDPTSNPVDTENLLQSSVLPAARATIVEMQQTEETPLHLQALQVLKDSLKEISEKTPNIVSLVFSHRVTFYSGDPENPVVVASKKLKFTL